MTLEDVPSNLLEPVAYVAFRWYCCVDREHGTSRETWSPLTPPVDYRIAVPSDPYFRNNRVFNVTAVPLWVRPDLSILDTLGGPPLPDVVLIAGYALSAFWQPSDFIIYRTWSDPRSMGLEQGHMSAADVRNWR